MYRVFFLLPPPKYLEYQTGPPSTAKLGSVPNWSPLKTKLKQSLRLAPSLGLSFNLVLRGGQSGISNFAVEAGASLIL